MTRIDYMKVIDIVSRSLNMEASDVKFQDASNSKICELILKGTDNAMIKVKLSFLEYDLELTLAKNYFSDPEFKKWISKFEYELEQAFLNNINVHVDTVAPNYVIKVTF